jgi:acetyl-CoA carboxylase carboxyl transferase subunit alpha
VVKEPLGGAHRDPALAASNLKAALLKHLGDLKKISPEALVEQRYAKYRAMGEWADVGAA